MHNSISFIDGEILAICKWTLSIYIANIQKTGTIGCTIGKKTFCCENSFHKTFGCLSFFCKFANGNELFL